VKLDDPVNFGSLRRLSPISKRWGFDRGTPIDRYYIEAFLEHNSALIHGHVLEIKDRNYTEQFGGDRVDVSEILAIDADNREATLIADITRRDGLSPDRFDCVIFTQTLQWTPEPEAALRNLHYILKPGGTLLLTSPGISKIQTTGPDGKWYWSFTPLSLEMMLEGIFTKDKVTVTSNGNVFAASCFLWGISVEEIEQSELDHFDPEYPVLLTASASKVC